MDWADRAAQPLPRVRDLRPEIRCRLVRRSRIGHRDMRLCVHQSI
jgi:hypothetical protein